MYFYVCMCIDTQYLPRNKGRNIQLGKIKFQQWKVEITEMLAKQLKFSLEDWRDILISYMHVL